MLLVKHCKVTLGGSSNPSHGLWGRSAPSEFPLEVSTSGVSRQTELARLLCPSQTMGICNADEQSDDPPAGHSWTSQNYSLNITFAHNPAFAISLEVPVIPLALAGLSSVNSSKDDRGEVSTHLHMFCAGVGTRFHPPWNTEGRSEDSGHQNTPPLNIYSQTTVFSQTGGM